MFGNSRGTGYESFVTIQWIICHRPALAGADQ